MIILPVRLLCQSVRLLESDGHFDQRRVIERPTMKVIQTPYRTEIITAFSRHTPQDTERLMD